MRDLGYVVKRRLHNSCHVCKCSALPGITQVRCKCGMVYCGRPRCSKRSNVEWVVFAGELLRGDPCVHCKSQREAAVLCPNSNCSQKKREGLESRRYSIGAVTIAQEISLLASGSSLLVPLPSCIASVSSVSPSSTSPAGLKMTALSTQQSSLSSTCPLSLSSIVSSTSSSGCSLAFVPLEQHFAHLGQPNCTFSSVPSCLPPYSNLAASTVPSFPSYSFSPESHTVHLELLLASLNKVGLSHLQFTPRSSPSAYRAHRL